MRVRSGVFWVITDSVDLDEYIFLPLYAKNSIASNHKKLWAEKIKHNAAHKPYNRKDYNHYPRGRVEIASNLATIYLNPHINTLAIVDEIKAQFGVNEHSIDEIRVVSDGSAHYECFLDWEDSE